ncbi:thymidine phosphorylase [Candidatus Ruminimicrobium bovinum]|uniref:thymidine phosphorylase n=1 Tax=Candidatus Ruminimicrobium bovinum TaxID=3242779 RepID=UPI0039B9106E
MRIYDIIYKKRNGEKLTKEEISFVIDGYNKAKIPEYQVSAFLMAVYFSGLNDNETFYLTQAMTNSGKVLDLSFLDGPTADKHSTGGVGDGTSLVIAPVLAACDIYVPMMSGRALGHTGGTLDKLEAIPGFNVNLNIKQFIKILKKNKFAMIGQTKEIAPVDKKMYALRDVTATVESIPLICSSIMSKKIAEGAKNILLDVKTGDGAFMSDYKKAKILAKKMVETGKKFGRNMTAVISDMDSPLGNQIGNSLEVIQTIEVLKNNIKNDFYDLCIELSALTIMQTKKAKDIKQARAVAQKAISSGYALEKFIKMIEYQGGNAKVADNYSLLGKAKNEYIIKAQKTGYIGCIQTRQLGICSCMLGAGRLKTEDKIDWTAGITIYKKTGDVVKKGDIVAKLFYNKAAVEPIANAVKEAFKICTIKPKKIKLIKDIII